MSLSDQKNALFGGGSRSSNTASGRGAATGRLSNSTSTIKQAGQNPGSTSILSGTTKISTSGVGLLSAASKAKKIAEAQQFSEKGMNALKKTLFNWSPDHLLASSAFEASANAYKAAGELELARMMILQCAESQEASNCLAAAANSCVSAAQLADGIRRVDLAISDNKRAAELWAIHGDLNKAAEIYSKIALQIGYENPTEALHFHTKAVCMVIPPGTPFEGLSRCHPVCLTILNAAFSFAVASGQLSEALVLANKQIDLTKALEMESSMCKTMCAVTIIQLTLGDVVQADHTFLQEHLDSRQYISSRECRLAETFLMALKFNDVDKLDEAKSSMDLNYLDKEVQDLAKRLSIFASSSDFECAAEDTADQLTSSLQALSTAVSASVSTSAAAATAHAIGSKSGHAPPPSVAAEVADDSHDHRRGSSSSSSGGSRTSTAAPGISNIPPPPLASDSTFYGDNNNVNNTDDYDYSQNSHHHHQEDEEAGPAEQSTSNNNNNNHNSSTYDDDDEVDLS